MSFWYYQFWPKKTSLGDVNAGLFQARVEARFSLRAWGLAVYLIFTAARKLLHNFYATQILIQVVRVEVVQRLTKFSLALNLFVGFHHLSGPKNASSCQWQSDYVWLLWSYLCWLWCWDRSDNGVIEFSAEFICYLISLQHFTFFFFESSFVWLQAFLDLFLEAIL